MQDAEASCRAIKETGAGLIYFRAVGLHMDKTYVYLELLAGAGFHTILLTWAFSFRHRLGIPFIGGKTEAGQILYQNELQQDPLTCSRGWGRPC